MTYLKELELEMIIMIVVAALIMLYSLWLTRRLFQVERLLSEYNKRITILSEGISLNRDRIMLSDIERKQDRITEDLIREFECYSRGNE